MTFSSVPHFQVKNLLKLFRGLPFTDLVMGSKADTISEQLSQEQEVIEVQSNHLTQNFPRQGSLPENISSKLASWDAGFIMSQATLRYKH